jgi:hypothetical protein
MLFLKVISTFITIVLFIIFFSILHFFLSNLPKAKVEIVYKPIYKPSISFQICQIIQNKFKCLESCIKEIENEISKIYEYNFEIQIDNKKIGRGSYFSEMYECIVSGKKVIIKI